MNKPATKESVTHGVYSESGKLRRVLVSRPGPAHKHLTPENCHELLFDDVLWVEKAASDHKEFCIVMENHGIEVLDISDLFTDVLQVPGVRKEVLDFRLQPNMVGVGIQPSLLEWLEAIPARF